MKTDLITSFDFRMIGGKENPFKGYVSSKDKTNIDDGVAVRTSKNVYLKRTGTWAARPGMKRRGTADTTAAQIDSSKVWYTSKGQTIVLRVSNSKLQFESDIVTSGTYVWYDLLTSLTQTRFIFDSWWDNTDKKDKLLFVAHDSNIYSWAGGIAKFVSYAASVITLDRAAATNGFASSGTVTIDGVDYTYTGVSGSTLTGTSDASAATANSVVYSKVVTTSNKPSSDFTNDFIKVVGNRVYCGSNTSRLIYWSSNTDFSNFTVPSPVIAGSPGYQILDSAAKGITVRKGEALVSAGTSEWYRIYFTIDSGTGTQLEVANLEKIPTAALQAAYSHEMIDVIGDSVIYLSQDQQLRIYGETVNYNYPVFSCLSQAVYDELAEETFTNGALRAIGEFIYITAPISGKVYLHQNRLNVDIQGNIISERLWHPYQQWNATRIDEISGIEYAFSNANPQIYRIWGTLQWKDDSPDNEDLRYECVLRLAYRNQRPKKVCFDKLFVEGFMPPGTELKSYILYDYQGANGIVNPLLNSTEKLCKSYIGTVPPAIGDAPIGDNPIGDGLTAESSDQERLPKFRVIKSLGIKNCFEYQVVIYSEAVDSRWEVLSLGTNEILSTEQLSELILK